MKTFKKVSIVLAIVFSMSMLFAACGGSEEPGQAEITANTGEETQNTETAQPVEKKKIVFYGKVAEQEASEKMLAATQDIYKDQYEIETIQVDMANLDKVIKTGIASGSPADIYFKQAQYMKSYVDANQALDLTPYLEENGGEWKNTFNQNILDIGKYNGKYYNIPTVSVFANFYLNNDILKKANVTIPDNWSWQEFIDICEQLKTKTDAFPFAVCGLCNDFMARNGLLSIGNDRGILEDLAAGKIEATDPIFSTVLKNTKELYDKGYWYPGEGAMTSTRDEVIAAFHQGKIVILADVNAVSPSVANGAEFEVGVARWPAMGTKNLVLGGADGLFIPVNAPHKEDAVKILKTYLSDEIQQINADLGFNSPNKNVVSSDPLTQKLSKISGEVYPYEFMYLTTKMSSFWQDVLIEDYCLGKPEAEVLKAMEDIRKEAVQ